MGYSSFLTGTLAAIGLLVIARGLSVVTVAQVFAHVQWADAQMHTKSLGGNGLLCAIDSFCELHSPSPPPFLDRVPTLYWHLDR